MTLFTHRKTDDPYFAAILLARQINDLCGGGIIAPWEVNELSDEWLDALTGISRWL